MGRVEQQVGVDEPHHPMPGPHRRATCGGDASFLHHLDEAPVAALNTRKDVFPVAKQQAVAAELGDAFERLEGPENQIGHNTNCAQRRGTSRPEGRR